MFRSVPRHISPGIVISVGSNWCVWYLLANCVDPPSFPTSSLSPPLSSISLPLPPPLPPRTTAVLPPRPPPRTPESSPSLPSPTPAMINPPDELLADLQSALPPDVEPSSPLPSGQWRKVQPSSPHGAPYYDSADLEEDGVVASYEMPRSSAERSVSPEVSWIGREREREGERGGEASLLYRAVCVYILSAVV